MRRRGGQQGVDAWGNAVNSVHPAPDATIMRTCGFGSLDLHPADRENVNLHY